MPYVFENDLVRRNIWGLCGRRKVFSDKREVTAENVSEIISKSESVHNINQAEIDYLYNYYRGQQEIRFREKEVRKEINNKITINHANEIVTFKTAYLLGEPIQYVSTGNDDETSRQTKILNEFMRAESKDAQDKILADWVHICGVGVRMVLPDDTGNRFGSPASIYTLDPRQAYVIYHSGVGERPIAGVFRQRDENGETYSCIYTPNTYFEVKMDKIIKQVPHALGMIPIIEYIGNYARLGAVEPVLPILDAINILESNRVDDIEQIVQSILVFQNCEIDKEGYEKLRKDGAVTVKGEPGNPAQVYAVGNALDQGGVQTSIDDLYQRMLTICGMPNRNGGSSTSDTGMAVIYRDGFAEAESRAKDTEKSWIPSETQFLKLFLRICRDSTGNLLTLEPWQVKIEFTRKNLSGAQSKSQMLCEMLNNDKIHPKFAYQASGLFPDSEEAYVSGLEWYEEQQRRLMAGLEDEEKVMQ